jgi:phosphohistidine phosphatase
MPMRTVYMLRHAKADDGGDILPDHARPLNTRGVRDAQAMGDRLQALGIRPARVLCSTATRTRETLEHVGLHAPVVLTSGLYLCSPGEMLSLIQAADDAEDSLMVIGHNPSMHAVTRMLAEHSLHAGDMEKLDLKFPTCALAALRFDCQRWCDVAAGGGTLTQLLLTAD